MNEEFEEVLQGLVEPIYKDENNWKRRAYYYGILGANMKQEEGRNS
jgi:hypothetical protein